MTGRMLVMAAVLAAPRGADADTNRFAIVIGNNQPESKETSVLRYADDDAIATHALLTDAGVDSVLLARLDDDTARLHPDVSPDAAPTLKALEDAFERVAGAMTKAGGDTELIVFYSGHGDIDAGEGYLVFEDGRLTRSALYDDILEPSPATSNHVIVDACNSYFVAFEKGAGGARERFGKSFAPRATSTNTGFVLSTSSERDSHEWERYQGGVFSHEVRSALRGAADADRDGTITYAELGAFLVTANEAIENARYRPDFAVHPPGRVTDALLAWTRPADLEIDADVGHVYVETAKGERIADAHAAPGHRVALRLPAARPLFVRTNDGVTEFTVEDAEPVELSTLPGDSAVVASRGALHLAFRKLFAVPFDGARVTAYRRRLAVAPPTLVTKDTPSSSTTRTAVGWIAVGSAAAGVAMNLWAAERHHAGEDASHADRVELNKTIRRANKSAIVLYTVAAVSGLTWWWMAPDSDEGVRLEPVEGGMTFSVEARW